MKQRWSRAIPVLFLVCIAAGAMLVTACSENPVGRKCFIGNSDTMSDTDVVVASPALEVSVSHLPRDTPGNWRDFARGQRVLTSVYCRVLDRRRL